MKSHSCIHDVANPACHSPPGPGAPQGSLPGRSFPSIARTHAIKYPTHGGLCLRSITHCPKCTLWVQARFLDRSVPPRILLHPLPILCAPPAPHFDAPERSEPSGNGTVKG